jgi:hypothetical protein
MQTTVLGLLTVLAGLTVASDHGVAAARQGRLTPVPRPAIAAIVDAFMSHDLVTLPHGHTRHDHEFLRSLVTAPGFLRTVDDILVEFGNARYQADVDRYVRGEDVTLAQIQPSWQNAVAPNNIWADEGFFEAVRAANRTRPKDRPLRILLGDPPIDWRTVKTRQDHNPWLAMRDSFPAALLHTEVLAKRRKALIVYGALHFQRRQVLSNYEMTDWRMETIVSAVERSTPQRVFVIWGVSDKPQALVPDVTTWAAPSLALTRGTTLGATDFGLFVPNRQRVTVENGVLVPLAREQWRPLPLEDQVDAVLYLGPTSAMTDVEAPARACAEPGFLEERLRRIALTGIPSFEADRLRRTCAK